MSEAQETSDYPTSLDTWITLTDKEDLAEASDINKIKASLLATQTELGLDPAGTVSTLVARLALAQATSGAIANGSAFPTSPTPIDGQIFYRTDENVLYIYNGSSWDSQGQSLSNVIFAWSGVEVLSAGNYGVYRGADLTPAANDTTNVAGFQIWYNDTTGYQTFANFKFTKISGIATITIQARLWTTNAGHISSVNVDIGGQSNVVSSSSDTTPTWQTATTIDVSGLSDGTTYDGIVQLKSNTNDGTALCSAVTLVAS